MGLKGSKGGWEEKDGDDIGDREERGIQVATREGERVSGFAVGECEGFSVS